MTGGCTAGMNPIKQTKQGATHFTVQVAPVTKKPIKAFFCAILGRFRPSHKQSRTSSEQSSTFAGHLPGMSQNIIETGLHSVAPDPVTALIFAKADVTVAWL
ncbi:hypothetical protein [Pseudomonas amygdali]|uniref:hypothetical protein n=1 Tax=Pseudomonas amygdali TaxID=47877 RepID=UPI000B143532|nr:hypothetical protein [Pseudomonas amygdali]